MTKSISIALLATGFIYADAVKLTDVEAKYNASSKVEATKELKQHIGLGFANTTGNTETLNFDMDYLLKYKTLGYANEELNIEFGLNAYISENDDVRDNEEYKAHIKMEQMILNGWFGYLSTNWLKNEFKNYDSKTGIGVGIGKEIIHSDNTSLKISFGVSYNFEEYSDGSEDYDYGALTQYAKYTSKLNDISDLYVEFGAMENFDDFDDYELSLVAGCQFAVAQNLNLSIEAEVDYDNMPSVGYEDTDTKTLIKLGYDF